MYWRLCVARPRVFLSTPPFSGVMQARLTERLEALWPIYINNPNYWVSNTGSVVHGILTFWHNNTAPSTRFVLGPFPIGGYSRYPSASSNFRWQIMLLFCADMQATVARERSVWCDTMLDWSSPRAGQPTCSIGNGHARLATIALAPNMASAVH